MKRVLVAALTVLTCFLVSCSSKNAGESTMSEKAKKNLEASNGVSNAFVKNDFSKLGDYIATDAVDHAGMTGDIVGLSAIKDTMVSMCKKMTNMKTETVKEFADDDWVFSWQKESGTMTVAEMGMPAGSNYTMNTIHVSKMKDGKITEHWSFVDWNDMMKMMAPMMESMPGSKPDSTHKM